MKPPTMITAGVNVIPVSAWISAPAPTICASR